MLAVGDSTTVEIIFNTKQYRSLITKSPRIETNEGKPDKSVSITCNVTDRPDSTFPLVVKPYKLDLSQFGERVRDQIKFTITNMSDKELEITKVYVPDGYGTLTCPAKVGAKATVEGSFKLSKAGLAKPFEQSFTIEVNDEQKNRFTIPIKREVRVPGQDSTAAKEPTAVSGH